MQTFNPEVAERIQRRQHDDRLERNFHLLREHTQAHLHADLILGLPGEDLDSMARKPGRIRRLSPAPTLPTRSLFPSVKATSFSCD